MATRARVLVIDDEPQVGRAMRRTLSEHDITVAGNAEQARSALLSGAEFDAVFCDVILPGASGIDLFLEPVMATEATPRARWIFMSGGTREPKLAEFLSRFDNPFLAKPCGPREVRAALARVQRLGAVEGRSRMSTVPAGARSSKPAV